MVSDGTTYNLQLGGYYLRNLEIACWDMPNDSANFDWFSCGYHFCSRLNVSSLVGSVDFWESLDTIKKAFSPHCLKYSMHSTEYLITSVLISCCPERIATTILHRQRWISNFLIKETIGSMSRYCSHSSLHRLMVSMCNCLADGVSINTDSGILDNRIISSCQNVVVSWLIV